MTREQWRQKFADILNVDCPQGMGYLSRTLTKWEQDRFCDHLYDLISAEKMILDENKLCQILVDTERMRSQYNRAIEIIRRLLSESMP